MKTEILDLNDDAKISIREGYRCFYIQIYMNGKCIEMDARKLIDWIEARINILEAHNA